MVTWLPSLEGLSHQHLHVGSIEELLGRSVAEWLGHVWTCDRQVPSSSPRTPLVNSQLFGLLPVGIFNLVTCMLHLNYLFH